MPISVSEVIESKGIIKAMVSDLAGGFKEIIFPATKAHEIVTSGIAYDGSSFAGINDINSSDAILLGQRETIVKAPANIADTEAPEYWIICNILTTDHEPHPNCARGRLVALQSQLAESWEGGNLYMGSEPECFFVDPLTKAEIGSAGGGNGNYFNPKDPKAGIVTQIAQALDEMGFVIERAHTEVGEDQFETNWQYDLAERTADKIQMYKLIAHKIARNHGLEVTFIPKPYPSRNGSGMHCHLSVATEERNLFYADNPQDLYFSEKAKQFLTGIANNARALCAIANPAEVSYARLVPGFEAPCIVAIGACNRSAACRIPAIADENLRKKAIRAEFRFPDPLANPYLLGAGFIAAGLTGLVSDVEFIGFTEENLYELGIKEIHAKGYSMLPRNLWEAYQSFEAASEFQSLLGGPICESYEELILEEIDACQSFANAESIRRHYDQ